MYRELILGITIGTAPKSDGGRWERSFATPGCRLLGHEVSTSGFHCAGLKVPKFIRVGFSKSRRTSQGHEELTVPELRHVA